MPLTPYPTLTLLEARWRDLVAPVRHLEDMPKLIPCSPSEMKAACIELSAYNLVHYSQNLYHADRDGHPLFLGLPLIVPQTVEEQ